MVEVLENSNLLDVQKGIICHQTNCIGAMGAGIALQIRKRWPFVYDLYKEECKSLESNPKKLLGHVQDIIVENDLLVANCYGQVYTGDGLQTDYKAWDIILDKLKDLANYFNLDLHFPWGIGCGLAGGDWQVMLKKIEDAFGKDKRCAYIHKLA